MNGRPGSARHFAIASLSAVFFVSGASALAFENVWFRQLGLAFGNGVWASGVVLASFMGGLAIGNLLASRLAARVTRPLLVYAALEVVVGLAGAGIELALPALPNGSYDCGLNCEERSTLMVCEKTVGNEK